MSNAVHGSSDRQPLKVAGSLDIGKPTLQMDATFVTFAAALQYAWAGAGLERGKV